MTSAPERSVQVGDRLPSLDLPLDPRWHDEDRTLSLRTGPRRAALLLFLPHGPQGARERGEEEDPESAPCGPCRSFIEDLVGASDTITLKGGNLAIAPDGGMGEALDELIPREAWKGAILSAEGARTMREGLELSRARAHLLVADRFGEVWVVYAVGSGEGRTGDGAAGHVDAETDTHEELPAIPQIVEWVDYLGTQCPECGVLDTTDRRWRTI